MELKYHGIKYEYNPVTVELTTEEVGGKYRGVEWKRYRSRAIPLTSNAVELKYRGVSYYSGNPEEVEKLKQQRKLNSIFGTAKKFFPRSKPLNDELAQTRSANLCRNLQRRLEVAKLSGDENLIRMLEDEASQLSVTNCQLLF